MKTILETYVPRSVRLGRHKVSAHFKIACSSYLDSELGVVRTIPRSEEMKGFTLDMFKLQHMLDAGIRIDPSPALFSNDKLTIASHCERVASSIDRSLEVAQSVEASKNSNPSGES